MAAAGRERWRREAILSPEASARLDSGSRQADDPSMREGLPTGTVTFLFTDVEGSTLLLHELGKATYADALATHRRVIREVCANHEGVEVDTQGDAFFFAFETAPAALTAAADLSTTPLRRSELQRLA
jgi:class 3 adenylate cyclase